MATDPDQAWREIEKQFRQQGFLAPLAHRLQDHFRHALVEWLDLARDLNRLGQCIYIDGTELLKGKPTGDPIAMGLQLVPRGLGAFQGAIILAEYGMAIEAKMLVRATFETAFWIGYLHEQPSKAVSQLRHGTIKGEMGLYRAILERATLPPDSIEIAQARLGEMEAMTSGLSRAPTIKDIADAGGFPSEFLHYKELSGGAAHVSLKSIFTYLNTDSDGSPTGHQIGPDEEGTKEAVYMACRGLMAVIEATRRLTVNSQSDNEFHRLMSRFDKIAPYNQDLD